MLNLESHLLGNEEPSRQREALRRNCALCWLADLHLLRDTRSGESETHSVKHGLARTMRRHHSLPE